ncbi:hypothetical protein AB3G45_05445 [Shinella sp. S4-D37]|uniref:hypothetical protein n=1 Tax=Shinella sp. S4-D37 TaxID=3161999 RepID=UPI003466102F
MGKGILAIWHDVAEHAVAEVGHWYNSEHHPERLAVPGFLAARRHRAVSETPLLFVIYDVEDVEVLASKPYLDRVNAPTEWTSRCMPHFRNNSRTVFRVAERMGQGAGVQVATLRIGREAQDDALLSSRVTTLMREFMTKPGSVSAEYWRADAARTAIQTEERRLRGDPDFVENCALVITSSDPELVAASARNAAASLLDWGLRSVEVGLYEMEFTLFVSQ